MTVMNVLTAVDVQFGQLYRISNADGHIVLNIDQLIGAVKVTIEVGRDLHRISGIGMRDGIGVRFYENGPDAVIADQAWRMCAVPGTGFMAELGVVDPPHTGSCQPGALPALELPRPRTRSSS